MQLQNLFNQKAGHLGSSIIAEMAGLLGPDGISFTSGEPSADLIPLEGLRSALSKAGENAALFSYPTTQGYAPLREWIVSWMIRENLAPEWLDPSCIILTNGSQGAVNLVAETFIDPGDFVLTESPTYPEALLAFQREGASVLPVPIDGEGPIPEALEEALGSHRAKFFYTVVNFQNPSGCTTSDRRKEAILELSRNRGFFILEDDPYRYLRYEGKPTRSYFEMAGGDPRVIYMGSFSKIIAPGVRCGWGAFPPATIRKLLEVRLSLELCPPALTQCAVFEFLRDCDLEKHIKELNCTYRNRRDALVKALENSAGDRGLRLQVPGGGFFLWGTCTGVSDMLGLARYAALEKKVGFIPGRFFYPEEGNGENTIRFAFAKVKPEQAVEGARRFREALDDFPKTPSSR